MARPLKTKEELKKETEEAFVKEFGITKEAAEKSAAIKEKDIPGYDPNKDDEELVFYSEDDKEEENEYPTFGKDFLESLDEDEPKYLSPAERRKQKTSDSMFNTYNTGEEWLMSDGDDLAKGFINNFRSAIGTGVEDFAFWLTENAPWYKPAQNVVEKNTAGKVEEQAQKQFGNAKANGVNGNVVDFLDNTSKNLGYSLLGFKAGDYAQGVGEGFNEYRNLRGQGYSKEEAAKKSLGKTSLAILSTKADDYVGKTSYKNANLNITNKSGKVITDKQFGKKIGKHTKEYNLNPKNEEDRKEMGRIINDIIDNADEVVEGKWKGQEGPILFYRKGEDLVLIRKNDDNFVSIFKGGANNGWFKDLGR